MKPLRFLAAAGLAIATLCAAPALSFADEKAAIENFKTDIQALDTLKNEEEAKVKGDPAGGVGMIRHLVAKMRTVRTEGLPAELKNGYAELVTSIAKMEKVFEGWPETTAEFQSFVQKKATEDPEF